jgi:excisionase family DNA binding protein
VHVTQAAKRRDFATEERRRTLSAVVAEAGPSKAEWVGWRSVARMLSRGRRWVYRRCEAGEFEARKDGNAWRIRRASVEAWIARASAPPASTSEERTAA